MPSSQSNASSSKRTQTQTQLPFSMTKTKRFAAASLDDENKPVHVQPQPKDSAKSDARSKLISRAIEGGDVVKLLGKPTVREGWCLLSTMADNSKGYIQLSKDGQNKVNSLQYVYSNELY